MENTIAAFGPFEFDPEEMVLRRDGEPVPLQPQPTMVLAILLESPGRLVGRDELKSRVWEGRIVEFDAGLNFSINQVRRALGDAAAKPRYLETIHRRGYRFIGEVRRGRAIPRRSPSWSLARIGAGAVALAGAVAVALEMWGGVEPAGPDAQLTALPPSVQLTFRTARWLYDQGEVSRALVRLDSVRLAAPGFAEAWTLTSHARRAEDDVSGARAAAERAVRLQPDLADAHYALGLAAFLQTRGVDALHAFATASRLAPRNVRYKQWYAQALANQLRLDEAIDQLEAARDLDPVSNLVSVDLASVYLAAGRFDQAVDYCTASLELVKDSERWARNCLLAARHFRGEDELATEQAHALMRRSGATASEIDAVQTLSGYFQWDLTRMERLASDEGSPMRFDGVRAHARLEERDETLRGLRSLRELGDFGIQWAPRDVWLRFLHGDPDFEAILREAGLPVPAAVP